MFEIDQVNSGALCALCFWLILFGYFHDFCGFEIRCDLICKHGVKSKIMEYSVFARIAIAYAINHLFNTWKELAMNVWKLHAAQKNNIDISTARFYCFCLVLPFTDNN